MVRLFNIVNGGRCTKINDPEMEHILACHCETVAPQLATLLGSSSQPHTWEQTLRPLLRIRGNHTSFLQRHSKFHNHIRNNHIQTSHQSHHPNPKQPLIKPLPLKVIDLVLISFQVLNPLFCRPMLLSRLGQKAYNRRHCCHCRVYNVIDSSLAPMKRSCTLQACPHMGGAESNRPGDECRHRRQL